MFKEKSLIDKEIDLRKKNSSLEEKLFSKYALKHRFGNDYIDYYNDMRIYKYKDHGILFEPVNSKQFRIHHSYLNLYRILQRLPYETKNKES